MSRVTCHLSHVTFKKKMTLKKLSFRKKLDKVVELVGGGFVINGAYPVLFRIASLSMWQVQTTDNKGTIDWDRNRKLKAGGRLK